MKGTLDIGYQTRHSIYTDTLSTHNKLHANTVHALLYTKTQHTYTGITTHSYNIIIKKDYTTHRSSGAADMGKLSLPSRENSISSSTGQLELTVTDGLRCFI